MIRPEHVRTRFAHLTADGTGYILGGSLVAGIGAYLYQFLGGRALGPDAFAPVSVLLTLHFLVFIVVLLPIEQLIVRRLTLRRDAAGIPARAVTLIAATVVGAAALAWGRADQLLRGDLRFVWFVAATIVTHAGFVIGRGHLAGWRRFRAYGTASAAASLLRLGIAAAILAVRPTASGFAVGLIVGPLIVVLWRPLRPVASDRDGVDAAAARRLSDSGLLTGLVLSAAASQALLLAGPLLVAGVGGGEALVSIAFATFTLSRAPLTFGYNLLARILPPFTEMAARGERDELRAWGRGLGLAAVALAVIGAGVGAVIGPSLVALAFGNAFRPSITVAAMIGAGVVLSGAGLFVGQVLVARGEPRRLAIAWFTGVAAAAVTILVATTLGPLERVAFGFLVGEAAALGALVAAAVIGPGSSRTGYALAKRSVDIGLGIVILLLSVPMLMLASIAIKIESRGPAFFRQRRIGKGGAPFAIVKMRTMRADHGEEVFAAHLEDLRTRTQSDAGSERLRISDDPRVTRVGRLLRKASIDELPNVWNVITGSMSLVGPRPLVPAEAEIVGLDHPRFSVKPGITGLAQISGRDEISLAERSDFDVRYVSTRSLRTDFRILALTVGTVIRRPGD